MRAQRREQQEQAAREQAELAEIRSRRLVRVIGGTTYDGRAIDTTQWLQTIYAHWSGGPALVAHLEAYGWAKDGETHLTMLSEQDAQSAGLKYGYYNLEHAERFAREHAARAYEQERMSLGGGVATAAAGAAAAGFVAGGGLMPSSASTKRNPVSWSDRSVGDGGNCTVYQRADGRYYVLDRYGRKGEGKTRVHGPAKFDSRSKVRGVR